MGLIVAMGIGIPTPMPFRSPSCHVTTGLTYNMEVKTVGSLRVTQSRLVYFHRSTQRAKKRLKLIQFLITQVAVAKLRAL